MTKERLSYLLRKHLYHQLALEEEEELMAYVEKTTSDRLLDEVMQQLADSLAVPTSAAIPGEEMYVKITHDNRFHINRKRRFGLRKPRHIWIGIAAGIAAICFLLYMKPGAPIVEIPVVPGKKTAVLTLADGRKINLNDHRQQLLTLEGGTRVHTAEGQLHYEESEQLSASDSKMENTLTTPPGGEYQAILPDGTKVWLNATSTIRYPVNFGNGPRNVSITGEVYLEVTQRSNQPFRVNAGNTQIDVLGTKFNISAYQEDKAVHTTLVEGRVKILAYGKEKLLKPGEQASTRESVGDIQVAKVDAEEALAWRNGYFSFSNEPLEQVMKKISRWYNVDVQYTIDPRNKRLEGTVSRTEDIHRLLKALELTKTAHFKLKERRIIVME